MLKSIEQSIPFSHILSGRKEKVMSCCGESEKTEQTDTSVDKNIVDSRKKICKECDVVTHFMGLTYCGNFLVDAVTKVIKETLTHEKAKSCGCVLDIKWRMKNAKCPQGKW